MGIPACPECGSTHVEELSSGELECIDCDLVFEEDEADYVDEEEDEEGYY